MTFIDKLKSQALFSIKKLGEVNDAKTAKTDSAKPKELDAAKTNENENVEVQIDESNGKTEKKSLFSKLWGGIKSIFKKDDAEKTEKTPEKSSTSFFGGIVDFFKNLFGGNSAKESKAVRTEETIDEYGHKVITHYNKDGKNIKESYDYDNDGKIDDEITHEYDKDGKIIKDTYLDANGNIDGGVRTYEYDKNGNLTKKHWDRDQYSVREETWQYDKNGNVTRYTWDDDDKDVDPAYVQTFKYDKDGNLIKMKKGESDSDAVEENYTYNEKGQLSGKTVDYGELKVETSYTYDEISGIVNGTYSRQIDEKGNVLETLYDRNGDGIKNFNDEYHAFKYDNKNQVIESKYDGSDGAWTEKHKYDKNGNIIETIMDYSNDGTDDYKKKIKYDKDGKIIETIIDYGNNGADDYKMKFKYDKDGNIIETITDYGNDGTDDEKTTFKYDKDGNMIKEDSTGL